MLVLAECIIWLFRFMLGACLFSFLNVIVWRLPRADSVVGGRSHCTTCNRTLTALELVPCFRWLFLKGRCKGCGEKISSRYFWVESLGGLLSMLCAYRFGGESLEAVLAFAILFLLTVVALIDWDTLEIWDRFPLLLALCGLLCFFVFPAVGWQSRLIGLFVISLPMFILAVVIPGAFGGGDIKLMAAMGLVLGWKAALVAGFLAILAGGLYGALLLLLKKAQKKDHFAFGPFLCAASGLALFAGDAIFNWYLSLFTL